MLIKLGLAFLPLVGLLAVSSPGCDNIERIYNCDQICDKYKECADENYDDDACGERCRDNAAASEAFEDKADDCQACIDGESCVEAAFECGTECSGIVP
jgi:hypothetical protein